MEANYFTILYWFCHTSTWICHGCTRVPTPEPPISSSLWASFEHGTTCTIIATLLDDMNSKWEEVLRSCRILMVSQIFQMQNHIPQSLTIYQIMCIHSPTLQFSPVSVVSDSLRPHEPQHARPPCPSPSLGVCSNSGPSSHWCHPVISSSVIPFSPPAPNPSQHQSLFQWVNSSHEVAKVLKFQL